MARRSYAKYDSYHISKMDTSYLTFFISSTGFYDMARFNKSYAIRNARPKH